MVRFPALVLGDRTMDEMDSEIMAENALSISSSPVYLVLLAVMIATAIHVIKTGRPWFWIWIILVLPGIGSLVYLFAEMLPDFRERHPEGMLDGIRNLLVPGWELKKLKEDLEDSDTVRNRVAVGDYYMRHRQPLKAMEIYNACLEGAFAGDAEITLRLCTAMFEAGQYEEARKRLEELKSAHPKANPASRDLLLGKSLEKLGQDSQAMEVYEVCVNRFGDGEECRCRYAALLEKAGEKERARAMYGDIVRRAKKFFPQYRRSQREWINLARKSMKRL
ncbi:MAG: hypothetical protein C0404_06595 [Verrucomicrobia bacterium]|nr:hypothetical protein [Verrucomicrobiota bacterium]